MIWLVLGIVLWVAAHFFKRFAPGARAAMTAKMGEASKAPIGVLLLISVVMIVIGFRSSDFIAVYEPPDWTRHVNNLLMVGAVVLFGLGHSKSRLRGMMRHPMLASVIVWAVAHLLVNGDLSSIILFGSMGIWAVLQMQMINRAEPVGARWDGGSLAGDIRLAVITVVIFAIITGVHTWLGKWPFPV
jgi:uncharacterized membrane protein